MTREELIERIKEAIQNKCTTVIDQTEHSTTTVGLQGALAERAATAALAALEAAGVRLVPALPTWPMIKASQCSVEAYDKMIAASPYAPKDTHHERG